MHGRQVFGILTAFIVGWLIASQGANDPTGTAYAQRASIERGLSEALASHSFTLADGKQQITVIDSRLGSMAVYHVNIGNGAIALKSVRNIAGDLRMDEFNGGSPSPKEIRTLMDQR